MEENNVNGKVTTDVSSNYDENTSRGTYYGGTNTTGNSYTTDSNTTNNEYSGNNYNTITNGTSKNYASGVPAKVSVWSKIKQFLCQEITVELTPRQERAFKDVYDFWHQDITVAGTKDFWLQDIEITL